MLPASRQEAVDALVAVRMGVIESGRAASHRRRGSDEQVADPFGRPHDDVHRVIVGWQGPRCGRVSIGDNDADEGTGNAVADVSGTWVDRPGSPWEEAGTIKIISISG